jgi:hypothetical protein
MQGTFYRRLGHLAMALLFLAPAPACALVFNADLSPIQIDAKPGDTVNRTFELHLGAGQPPAQFVSRVEDWWPSEDGTTSFFRPVGSVARSCGRWVELNPVEAAVGPGGVLAVQVTTAIPSGAAPGGYWCVLTVDEVPNPLASQSGVGVRFVASVSVGIFVYLAPVERAARIVEVDVKNGRASVLLHNDGNSPLRVEGRFEFFRRGQGVPVAVAPLPRTTLVLDPAPVRRITIDLPDVDVLPAGHYLVRAVLDLGLDHYVGAQKELDIDARRSARPAH